MADDLKPTLAQAKQIASGSWPTAWNVDSALAPEVLATEIARLEAENAALKQDLRRVVERHIKIVTDLATENAALRKDAEALEWLLKMWPLDITRLVHSHHPSGPTSSEPRTAIDAAMSKEEQRG